MALTRKDFIELAAAFENLPPADPGMVYRSDVLRMLVQFCEGQNQGFDRERFIKAARGDA